MTYNLVYTHRSIKDVHNLDPTIKKRIGKALLRLEKDPFANSKRLVDSNVGTYRFRIGDYRVIFDIQGDDIVILRIGHRNSIYRTI